MSLTNKADHDVTVAYSLHDGTAHLTSDFTDGSGGTITIAAGQTSANITVNVVSDSVFESPEAFTVQLDSAIYNQGGANSTALTINTPTATGNIKDNDQQEVTNSGRTAKHL